MQIHPITAFNDNYIWALIDSNHAIIVDPGDAQPVIEFLDKHQYQLSEILITHHHWDHTNGVEALRKKYGAPVFAPAKENIPHATPVNENYHIIRIHSFPEIKILDIPGHTLGHIAYLIEEALFCGDTLFAAGCGRLFEGTAAQMYASLQKLANLPEATKIYCGHEYTLNNLNFAKIVEPNNQDIVQRIEKVKQMRDRDQPSLPSTISAEKTTNPFLRCHHESVRQSVEKHVGQALNNPLEVFTFLRQWKDKWK